MTIILHWWYVPIFLCALGGTFMFWGANASGGSGTFADGLAGVFPTLIGLGCFAAAIFSVITGLIAF